MQQTEMPMGLCPATWIEDCSLYKVYKLSVCVVQRYSTCGAMADWDNFLSSCTIFDMFWLVCPFQHQCILFVILTKTE